MINHCRSFVKVMRKPVESDLNRYTERLKVLIFARFLPGNIVTMDRGGLIKWHHHTRPRAQQNSPRLLSLSLSLSHPLPLSRALRLWARSLAYFTCKFRVCCARVGRVKKRDGREKERERFLLAGAEVCAGARASGRKLHFSFELFWRSWNYYNGRLFSRVIGFKRRF